MTSMLSGGGIQSTCLTRNILHYAIPNLKQENITQTKVIETLIFQVMMCNATFNNISTISWQAVLLVEDSGVPGENHRPATSQ